MKKLLLTALAVISLCNAQAQQRLVLFEEFSGENCGPCAAVNPGLWSLISASGNASKVLMIKYQVPIPSAGPLYYQNTADPGGRRTYYGVSSAPNARMDGVVEPWSSISGNDGHPADLTQSDIDTRAAISSPFNITVTPTVTGVNNLSVSVQVNAVSAYTATTAKLHVALIETMYFDEAPGTNGETDFHNVVRKMYPGPSGQAISNTWTSGQSNTYTATGTIPAYVDRSNDLYIVAWIQDDGDQTIAQAAKSAKLPPAPLDAKITAIAPAKGSIFCGSTSPAHTVTVKNTGTTTLTSVKIHTKVGTGAYGAAQNFTVNLAANATTTLTLPAISGGGTYRDSIGQINNVSDDNLPNNAKNTDFAILTSGASLPMSTGFEGLSGQMLPTDYMVLNSSGKYVADPVFNSTTWFSHTETGIKGWKGSAYTCIAPAQNMDVGNTTIATFPYVNLPAGNKSVKFYYAYAQRGSVAGDKLEVVYSTNCGTSWTSLWSRDGANLATAPAVGSQNLFLPASDADWEAGAVNLSSVPAGNTLVGFRATSGGGNLIYIDSVKLSTDAVTGLNDVIADNSISLYPNPTRDEATLELNVVKVANVSIYVIDVTGRTVANVANEKMNTGSHKVKINTTNLPSGIYNVKIQTEEGSRVERLTVVK